MASLILFFQPARLPLAPEDLGGDIVQNLAASPELRAQVEQAFPGLAWQGPHRARAEAQGNWYEVQLPEATDQTLALRCSLRVDHGRFVQSLCDRFGWLAFDEQPLCYQPHRAPIPA